MTANDLRATAACRIPGCPIAFPAPPPRIRERDLAHDANPVRFGYAMLKCEGYSPACSNAGKCGNGGRCFGSAPNLIAARMVEAMIPADQHTTGPHFAYLRRVAEMLRNGHIHL